ncbi:hypothetical protein CDAR_394791 [Caerostris darwini]|uniref:Uncharacterized protein n=1 Tax=Caerostris darwini TaxID=1538125 RepID=A0AAV4VB20_9ARAC|nr:hypothetical protein CDAR_394791 [Caerostris darwini]
MDEKDPVVVFAPRHAAMIFSENTDLSTSFAQRLSLRNIILLSGTSIGVFPKDAKIPRYRMQIFGSLMVLNNQVSYRWDSNPKSVTDNDRK